MEKKLLITLSDKNSINDSKRLFTNIQSKKLWKFELMLLAYKIPKKELNWFTDRGIKIKRCDKPSFIPSNFNPVKSNKFLLFEKEFKKWNNIVYLDSDIIIKSNINELGYVKEFSAVQDDLINGSLIDQLIHPKLMSKNKLKQFRKKFSFLSPAFNSGVMAFPTTIINKDTIKNLKKIINEYADIKKPLPTDQPILNLLFYKKWKKLPIYYNLDMRDFIFLGPKRLNKGIFHFVENSKE
ncbi:hypothetical protein KAH94_03005, partial [bacterium]|nr:hypothetical protein [bacterium]